MSRMSIIRDSIYRKRNPNLYVRLPIGGIFFASDVFPFLVSRPFDLPGN